MSITHSPLPKTALITGASRGLGRALAHELARRGWNLIVDARGLAALEAVRIEIEALKDSSATVVAISGDVAQTAHRQALAEAARALGGLDAVVNNASLLGPSPQPALLDYPLEVLEEVYRANVFAPLGVLQAVRATLRPHAHVLNITSDAGVEAYAGWGGYGSSKAALEQLSAVLAKENPQWRVYWVDPGDMRTQMHQDAFPNEDISDRPLPEVSVPGLVELLEGEHPSGRYRAQTMNAPTSGVQEMRLVLTTDDLAQAARLYREGFQLKLLESWESPEGRGMVLAAGAATLELLDRPQANRIEQIEARQAVADPIRLAFKIPDTVAAATSALEHGAQFVAEPVLTPWRHFNQRVRADGIQITLFQPMPEGEVEAVA